MSAIFQRMLENVDDTLFDFAGHSQSMEERRNLFDSMRLLRKSARPLIDGFEAALQGAKATGTAAADFEEWTLVNDEAVEEDIVISRVVARIEDSAKQALWEYTIRMENLPAVDQQAQAFERLRPPGITKAFRETVSSLAIDPSTKLILFKLFERQLVSDGSTVYEGINLRLEAAGVSSKTLARRDPHSQLPPGEPERREPPEFVASYVNHVAPSYQIPAALSSLVSSAFGPAAGGGGAGVGYGEDPGVAAQPGAMGSPAGAGPALSGPGGRQRMSLVAQLLLDQTRGLDSNQSQAAHHLLVPLLRIALGDPGFFSDPQHPARALLSSLVGASQSADGRLAEVSDRLNSLASGVQAPDQVAPLSGAELRQFLLSQRSAGASTSARIEEGRAAAYQQIRSVGSGRDLPVGVAGFLNQIWLPMVSAMHLKFGAESEEMRRAAQILQRLFGEVRWLPEMKDSAVVQAILEELEKGLRDIAVPAPLITKARTVLADGLGQQETARKLLDLETLTERAQAPATAAATDTPKPGAAKTAPFMGDDAAWRAALPVSSWFRVFDRASDQTQWLSAGVFYPQSRTLSFNGFDGAARLSIERSLFVGDLVDGKAEAVDPTELQQSSIRLLCLEFTAARKTAEKAAAKTAVQTSHP
jgi:hypothetical protein